MNWKDKFILRYASKEPWQMTSKECRESCLFHGTGEPIHGDLRGGGFDNVFWTAQDPEIAQMYIMGWGTRTVPKPYGYDMEQTIRPEQGFTNSLLNQMGAKYTVHKEDHMGRATEYSFDGAYESWPRKKDMVSFLAGLGYKYDDGKPYYYVFIAENDRILPASYVPQGELYILLGKSDLNIYDYTNSMGDLMDPDYLKVSLFKKVMEAGYDGIKINDYAQSKNWGNLGHVSVGLFPSGLQKLKKEKVPAKSFDFGDTLDGTADEFSMWHRQQVLTALSKGYDVPQKVLDEYGLGV
jgi:hypothetical protein